MLSDTFLSVDGRLVCLTTTYCESGDLAKIIKHAAKMKTLLGEKTVLGWFVQVGVRPRFQATGPDECTTQRTYGTVMGVGNRDEAMYMQPFLDSGKTGSRSYVIHKSPSRPEPCRTWGSACGWQLHGHAVQTGVVRVAAS